MRLHYVELFYVFLLYFHGEGSEERGQSVTTRPSARAIGQRQAPIGAPSCGQGPYRGGRRRLGLPTGRPQGQPPAVSPQWAAGSPAKVVGPLTARVTASRGSVAHLEGLPPEAAAPTRGQG
ncbi:hypothetical protein B296_00038336 [Ensete ventricosum]|uniref:Uncharacterized protein n=1 Tax=Ensete ventricosum TaxID=4639 RepID=A0A426Z820_ENSVE|nr:hypothetical protein B296_00038336 [Ensete ventricosum]